MKNIILILLLLMLSMLLMAGIAGTARAGDSGLYFDPDRNGEGIVLQRQGDTVVTYLFTYGEDICGLPIVPIVSPEPPTPPDGCEQNGQRWFLGVDDLSGNVVSGVLYITDGFHYPDGQTNTVGKETAVGRYTLVREGAGWLMAVDKFGPELPADDPLFSAIYDFTTKLFEATD